RDWSSDVCSSDLLAIAREAQSPAGRIEGGEELVLGEDLAVGQGVEQRGLAGVRIAHDGDHGQAAPGPLPTPDRAAGGDGVDLLFQEANAIADPSPVDLELGLAGAAPADAAHEPGQARIALLGQSRQKETKLRQLHLQLAFGALRSLSEDVEDELG